MSKAQDNHPELIYTVLTPDITEFTAASGDSILLDLGEHAVGHFSFAFDRVDIFVDAPVRLVIKFGEDMREINDDFSQYKGTLSKTWLQEEIINLDFPQRMTLPRRYACRYIKITVEKAKQPVTPYMRHYVTEAMLKLDMKDEAVQYLKKFWGGMLECGADTFWEAYIPDDLDFSPYEDRMINSLCHAWSCTPSYFIRKYGM